MVPETRVRTVNYTVMQKVQFEKEVMTCRLVAKQVPCTVTLYVPKVVTYQVPVQVQVCRPCDRCEPACNPCAQANGAEGRSGSQNRGSIEEPAERRFFIDRQCERRKPVARPARSFDANILWHKHHPDQKNETESEEKTGRVPRHSERGLQVEPDRPRAFGKSPLPCLTAARNHFFALPLFFISATPLGWSRLPMR